MLINKIEESILKIKKTIPLSLKYQSYGAHLAFSGGKDSQVIHELYKMANAPFKAFFYKTSVDPPELLKFIKENYPKVEWLKPPMTMFQLIEKKGMLPLRQARFCCDWIKERKGLNSVVVTGLTSAESIKRRNRKTLEHSCIKGNDKILFNPILNWTHTDVFRFLKDRNLEYCELYKIQGRIGCVGCPMSPKSMRKDFIQYPNFKKAYINTVKKLIAKGKYSQFESAEDVINWWSSGLSRDVYLANKYQNKLF